MLKVKKSDNAICDGSVSLMIVEAKEFTGIM